MQGYWSREKLIAYAKEMGFVVEDGIPQQGEIYIAGRTTGPHLLTCAKVDERGWIMAKEDAYSFDWNECVKVRLP